MSGIFFSSTLCVLILTMPVAAQTQVNLSSVTVRLGAIRTLQTKTDDGGHLWALYPEVQVGGVFFTPSLSWGLSWGYWDDGLNQAINWMDYTTMSQNGHIIALRAAFEPQKADSHAPIPLKIFAGLAEHIIFDHYIGGAGVNGAHLPDSTYYSTTLSVGLSLAFSLSSLLQLEAEAEQFFPFTSGRYGDAEKGRRNFKLGVVFNF